MQWPFAAWGADAVLAGHDHLYERLQIDGIPYLTIGSSGNPNLYDFKTILPESVLHYNDEYGAIRAEASETALTFTFETRNGEIIDTIHLTQSSAQPTDAPPSVTAFPNPVDYQWSAVATDLNSPIEIVSAGDGSGRLFIIEQRGAIRVLQDGQLLPTPYLDIRAQVGSEGNEQGLLGLAFHPDYAQNGIFFLDYTDLNGNTVVSRWQVSADPNLADPASETAILSVKQPYSNHNGGHLTFGPDGYLYIGLGDGGSAGDPAGNAQNTSTLLGKILRLDVDRGTPYAIPPDNPFAAGGGSPEIWAWGLRNPWKFSFDRATGDLYIGDVGQNLWEEVDFWEASAPLGANFGWNFWEG
ncbi:MAG TPA: hypothetical protein DEH25_07705, partial [Chloroflexi bacterium]|nr:hypothetical protein [Chloroflexota bacterium]